MIYSSLYRLFFIFRPPVHSTRETPDSTGRDFREQVNGQQVSERFSFGDTFLERPAGVDSNFAGTLINQAKLTLNSMIDGSELRVLQVIEGTDSLGGRHRFCFLRRYVGPGKTMTMLSE